MIEKKRTENGSRLMLQPFSGNPACQIIVEITSIRSRRDARLRITDLQTMTIGDTAILMNNLRAMLERVQREMGLAQARAARKATKSVKKPTKKR